MKTLGKNYTRLLLKNENSFAELEQAWKAAIREGKEFNRFEHFCYAVLRGKNYLKGYTLATNKVKLENGYKTTNWLYLDLFYICINRNMDFFSPFISDDASHYLKRILPRHYDEENPYKEYKESIVECTVTSG